MPNYYIVAPGSNLDICLQRCIYGQKQNLISKWTQGDRVIYYVEREFAALATVVGEPFFDNQTRVWPDDIYPYRIKVVPDVVLPRGRRIRADHEIRTRLQEALGKFWMLHIRSARRIPEALFRHFQALIESVPGVVAEPVSKEALAVQREALKQVSKRPQTKPKPITKTISEEEGLEELIGSHEETQSHDRTQWYLLKLGRMLGCDVWVAKNDQNKSYKGEKFADICLKRLPNLGFDADTTKIIEHIDVLWLKSNVVQCAFEIEHTTVVYSGLLRLADLLTSQPNIKIKLFIVAPQDRKSKVIQQLNRPMFRDHLCEVCKFIAYDKLERTLAQIEDWAGYLQVGLVEKIAESCKIRDTLHD